MNKGNKNLRFTALEDYCYIEWQSRVSVADFYYKRNNDTDWTHANSLTGSILLENAGDYVELYGEGETFNSFIPPYTITGSAFSSNQQFKISGEIASLVKDKMGVGCFLGLFNYSQGLVDASDLIFPDYTNAYCYYMMFAECSNLQYPPKELPAEVVETNAYNSMFEYNESLLEIPVIKGKVYKENACFCTFDSCESLKEASISYDEAESSAFNSTFQWCSNLEKASIFCNHIDSDAFIWTFYECPNLSTVICTATDFDESNPTRDWLEEVSETGTFYKAKGTNWPRGINGIPEGWEVKEIKTPKPIRITYNIVKDIYLLLGGTKYCSTNYDLAYNILNIIEDSEITKYTGKTPKSIDINLYINGDDRYYTFSNTLTSGDYLEGNIKINGIIPAGSYKGFVTGNEVSAILTGSNYNCQAVALKKEGDKYVSK